MAKQLHVRVEVHWLDTLSSSHWMPREQVAQERVARCRTIGYLIGVDVESIRLSHTLSEDDGDFTIIPLGCIQSIILLGARGKTMELAAFYEKYRIRD